MLLQLLASVHDPDVEFESAEEIVSSDVALSYRLLRHVNSARFGLNRKVDSIRDTLVFMGMNNVRSMASLFLLGSIEDKPQDLIQIAMQRAKMCQLLAQARKVEDFHPFFTVGLLSTLDALMDAPLAAVLEELPLADELRRALLDLEGDLGRVLEATLAYERGDWDRVQQVGMSADAMRSAFLEALEWARAMEEGLAAAASE